MYKKALNVIKWQAMLSIAPVFLFFLYAGFAAGFSASYGLLINLAANSVMAFFIFRYQGALAAKTIVRLFYLGEAVKIMITVLMFWAAVVLFKLPFLPLMISFIFSQLAWLICPMLATKKVTTVYE